MQQNGIFWFANNLNWSDITSNTFYVSDSFNENEHFLNNYVYYWRYNHDIISILITISVTSLKLTHTSTKSNGLDNDGY